MSRYSSYSSGIGERILSIDSFHGIDQSRGTHSADYGTSPDATNFIARDGKLRVAGGVARYGSAVGDDSECQGRLHQAFFRSTDGQDSSKLLMFINGCIYASDPDCEQWTQIGSGFQSDDWDVVNYRDEIEDLAIMTNGIDKTQYWDGKSASVSMLADVSEDVPNTFAAPDAPAVAAEEPDEPECDYELARDASMVLSASDFPSYAGYADWKIEFTADNDNLTISPSSITSLDQKVTVVGKKAGKSIITAKMSGYVDSAEAGYYSEHVDTLSINVVVLSTFIILGYPGFDSVDGWINPDHQGYDKCHLNVGDTVTLSRLVRPEDFTEALVWESSDPDVATVDNDGRVTVKSPGECYIECKPAKRSGPDVRSGGIVLICHKATILPDDVVYSEPLVRTYGAGTGICTQIEGTYKVSDLSDNWLSYETTNQPKLSPDIYCTVEGSTAYHYKNYSAFISFNLLRGYAPNEILSLRLRVKMAGDVKTVIGCSGMDKGRQHPDLTYWGYADTRRKRERLVVIEPGEVGVIDITDLYESFKRNESPSTFGALVYNADLKNNHADDPVPCVEYIQYEMVLKTGTAPTPEVLPEKAPTSPIMQGGDALVFSQIALLRERLWGAVSPAYPDRVYWSNTFDPNDWELNWEDSENTGGGFVDIATFDGTRIRAILSAFDEVLVFKDKSIHRIVGSAPGEFSVASVYSSEGTLAPRSIVYTGDKVYFLATDGLCVYNGVTASPMSALGDRKLKDIWKRVNESTISTACAVLKDNIIYLAIPLDGSIINTHVIEYNLYDGSYSIVEIAGVDDWLLMREGQKETLLYLCANEVKQYGVGYTFDGEPIHASWISPEISGGSLSSRKTTGRIYMRLEAHSMDISKQPSVKLTMSNGGKDREKVIRLKEGMNDIRKRVKVRGRTFRFKIENVNGDPLTIHRGIEIVVEEDYD